MAGNSRPSFLKRQKEQKRLERANEKRAVRAARREAKANPPAASEEFLDADVEGQENPESVPEEQRAEEER